MRNARQHNVSLVVIVHCRYLFQSRFCSNLGLPSDVQKAATHIARKAVDLDLVPG